MVAGAFDLALSLPHSVQFVHLFAQVEVALGRGMVA